jgi:RNA polymerase sigma-70 factor (ECF subfamily)
VDESTLAINRLAASSPEPVATRPSPLASGGSRERLAELYAEYAHFVAWFASRLLTRQDEVDDMVQEVFLIAATNLDGLSDPPKIRGWLKTVTLRRAGRLLRWKRVRARFGIAAGMAGSEAWIASPDASPEDRAALREVLSVLDKLAVDLRIAWSLRHLHKESLEDIAELVGCSLATVKRRIAAAEARIHEELADD